jgi:hypothetical protein
MKVTTNKYFTYLTPDTDKHISNVDKTEMYEGQVYLGKNDLPENYIEVTEQEYQEWKLQKEQEAEAYEH